MAAGAERQAGRPRLGRDRLAVAAALAGVTLLAWAYLVVLSHRMGPMPDSTPSPGAEMPGMAMPGPARPDMGGMAGVEGMPGMAMPAPAPRPVSPRALRALVPNTAPWTPVQAALTFAMWWVMMIGMMTPSAAPMILMFDRIAQRNRARGAPAVPTALFAGAYLAVWGAFSLVATAAEWALERAALMAPMQHLHSAMLGGGLFLVAGIYQFTPLKQACLRQCRSPLSFLMGHWRDGTAGALALGARHGLYCLGCCWFLMVLLFVFGVMNLLWVAALAAYVLAEKLFPAGPWIARIGGVAMIGFGIYLIAF